MYNTHTQTLADCAAGHTNGAKRGRVAGKAGDASAAAATIRSGVLGRSEGLLSVLALLDLYASSAHAVVSQIATKHPASAKQAVDPTGVGVGEGGAPGLYERAEAWDTLMAAALRAMLRAVLYTDGRDARLSAVRRLCGWFKVHAELRPGGPFVPPRTHGAAAHTVPATRPPPLCPPAATGPISAAALTAAAAAAAAAHSVDTDLLHRGRSAVVAGATWDARGRRQPRALQAAPTPIFVAGRLRSRPALAAARLSRRGRGAAAAATEPRSARLLGSQHEERRHAGALRGARPRRQPCPPRGEARGRSRGGAVAHGGGRAGGRPRHPAPRSPAPSAAAASSMPASSSMPAKLAGARYDGMPPLRHRPHNGTALAERPTEPLVVVVVAGTVGSGGGGGVRGAPPRAPPLGLRARHGVGGGGGAPVRACVRVRAGPRAVSICATRVRPRPTDNWPRPAQLTTGTAGQAPRRRRRRCDERAATWPE
jgi:hypothetical protein